MNGPILQFQISPVSENSLLIRCTENGQPASPTPALSHKLASVQSKLKGHFRRAVFDSVISYNTLLVYYDFLIVPFETLARTAQDFINTTLSENPLSAPNPIEIPVLYNSEKGPDLASMAKEKGLSIDEIITLHTSKIYTVFAMGFSPGFPFLGFVDRKLKTARHTSPRKEVPKGSVGIAESQTGIYPDNSPGGWNIIGRTPLNILPSTNKNSDTLDHLINTGDRIKFYAINNTEFSRIENEQVKQRLETHS